MSATTAPRPGAMSDRRRDRIRLEISREAARLFWQLGVAATSGEQIADAVGLSVRTLWRYFRTKESCVEPIVVQGVEEQADMLRRWPPALSLEQHLAAELTQRGRRKDEQQAADDLLSVQMVGLADTEPAIRSAWLMACDRVERQLVDIVAARLPDETADDVRAHAAASAAVIRVVNEDISRTLLAGRTKRADVTALSERLARSVRTATGDALGDPVAAPSPPTEQEEVATAMNTLTREDVRRALVNVTKSERAAVTVPADFDTTDWPTLDFFGWRDPKFPQRGYLVRVHDGEVAAVAVSTVSGGLPPGRKAMCSICRAVDNSSSVALFTARRAGPAGRKGDTVGTYICSELDCSAQLRHPGNRVGRVRLDTDEDVDVAAAAMLERLDGFLDTVRAG